MMRYIYTMCTAVALSMLTVGVASADTITVGGKNFTEQLIMASMTSQLLDAHGFDTDKRDGMGTTVLRKAQVNGQIDVYWEYTGTSLVTFNKMDPTGLSPKQTIDKVRAADKKKGLVWLQCSDSNNTYAVAVKKGRKSTADIQSISDLAKAYQDGKNLKFAMNAEFSQRKDGFPGLEKAYDFKVARPDIKTMDSGLVYTALNQDQVDASMVFATDGRIAAFHFRVLKDDKNFFPNYAMCPVIRADTLKANPKLRGLLDKLASDIDSATMRSLNKMVDVDKKSVNKVAKQFLQKHDLL